MIIVVVTILRDFMGQSNHGTKEELLQNSFFFHRQSMGMPPRHHPISGARYIRHPRFEGPRRCHGSGTTSRTKGFVKHEQQPGHTSSYIIIHLILKTVLTLVILKKNENMYCGTICFHTSDFENRFDPV